MARQQHAAAAREVFIEQCVDGVDAVAVECVIRLVEDPQRLLTLQCQPRQRGAAALALRERTHQRIAPCAHADAVQRGVQRSGARVAAVQQRQKTQRLGDAQVVLQCARMRDVDQTLRHALGFTHRHAAPRDAPRLRQRQAGGQAQQARLAAAVAPAQPRRAAGIDCEVDAGKQAPVAAPARQIDGSQRGQGGRRQMVHARSDRRHVDRPGTVTRVRRNVPMRQRIGKTSA